MSVPHSNSTQTTAIPVEELERTRRTPVAPFMVVSMGKATRLSTSAGARPCASASTVSVGAVRSGKTSTGIRSAVSEPPMSRAAAIASTIRR